MKPAEREGRRARRGEIGALAVAVIVHAGALLASRALPAPGQFASLAASAASDPIDVALLAEPTEARQAPPEIAPASIASPAESPKSDAPAHAERAAKSIPHAPPSIDSTPLEPIPPNTDPSSARGASATEPHEPSIVPTPPHVEPLPSAPSAPHTPDTSPAPPLRAGPPSGPPPDDYGRPPSLPSPPSAGGAMAGLPGLPGAPVWALPGALPLPEKAAPAPTTAAPAPAVDRDVAGQVLGSTLRKKEDEAGISLPSAGIVAGVVGEVVRSASLPDDSRATFEVDVSGQGDVSAVRVVSSTTGDAAVWQRMVGSAKAQLASRALAAPSDARGVLLRVKVVSSRRTPSGAKKAVDVRPVCANEVIEQIEQLVEDPSSAGAGHGQAGGGAPTLGAGAAPPVPGARRSRLCIPVGVAGVVDASDLGAHLVTVVKSTVEIVRAGDRALPSGAALPIDDRAPWIPALLPDPTRAPRPLTPPRKKKKKESS